MTVVSSWSGSKRIVSRSISLPGLISCVKDSVTKLSFSTEIWTVDSSSYSKSNSKAPFALDKVDFVSTPDIVTSALLTGWSVTLLKIKPVNFNLLSSLSKILEQVTRIIEKMKNKINFLFI